MERQPRRDDGSFYQYCSRRFETGFRHAFPCRPFLKARVFWCKKKLESSGLFFKKLRLPARHAIPPQHIATSRHHATSPRHFSASHHLAISFHHIISTYHINISYHHIISPYHITISYHHIECFDMIGKEERSEAE